MDKDIMHENLDPDAEVDPELLVKCRLCVTKKGVFQILPLVQDQIKFCFQITVKVFDGLPQVLCKTCKHTLNQFELVKKTFIANQKILEQMQQKKGGEDDKKRSEALVDPVGPDDEENDQPRVKRRRIRIVSDNSENPSEETSVEVIPDNTHKSWSEMYEKKYVCRFCGGRFKTLYTLSRHKLSHPKLIESYDKYKISHCTVKMDKIDLRPNLTGETTTVVLSPTNIMSEPGDPGYYISFIPNELSNLYEPNMEQTRTETTKKRLGISRSSSRETLVIDDADDDTRQSFHDDGQKQSNGFISVDDSSTSDSLNHLDDAPNQSRSMSDMQQSEIINNIVALCQAKYAMENKEKNAKDSIVESNLIRKLLSVGTKIMTSPGCVIASPGLLKYLEHENLGISWNPINSTSPNSNYVRISVGVDTDKDVNEGWTVSSFEPFPEITKAHTTTAFDKIAPQMAKPTISVASARQDLNLFSKGEASLVLINSDCNSLGNKLLNESPVINPKKLPKKAPNVEVKPHTAAPIVANRASESRATGDVSSILIDSDDDATTDSMPTITSIESLATSKVAEKEPIITTEIKTPAVEHRSTDEQKTTFPRIKCKPVSELMAGMNAAGPPLPAARPPTAAISDSLTTNIPKKNPLTITIMPTVTNGALQLRAKNQLQLSTVAPSQVQNPVPVRPPLPPADVFSNTSPNVQAARESTTNAKTSVAELTDQPVKYFKSLLKTRNVQLISDIRKEELKSFTCLVKYKLECKQQDKAVVISLALFALNDRFCIKLKKPNHDDIDIYLLPSQWQMYILKSFQGAVSEKILNSASKVSPTLLKYAQKYTDTVKQIDAKNISKIT